MSSSERANFHPHPFHEHWYGFSPVCVLRWAFRCDDLVYVLAHPANEHRCVVIFFRPHRFRPKVIVFLYDINRFTYLHISPQNRIIMYFKGNLLLSLPMLIFLLEGKEASSYLLTVQRHISPLQRLPVKFDCNVRQISLHRKQSYFHRKHELYQILGFYSYKYRKGSPQDFLPTGMQVISMLNTIPYMLNVCYLNR